MLTDETLTSIAQTYGTPVYVYDLSQIDEQLKLLKAHTPKAHILYAIKANPNGRILKHLASQGIGAEVISEGELIRALRAGMAPEHILLGGPRQDTPLIQEALKHKIGFVSLDSWSQWDLWETQLKPASHAPSFLIRINPALDPRTHEHLATGAAKSKFGMPLAEAIELAHQLYAHQQLAGFHIHAGSQIQELSVYDEIFALLVPLYERFAGLTYLDIGGGFAVPDFKLDEFTDKLTPFSNRFNVHVIIEPGRYLLAQAGFLISKILHIKSGPIRHIIADAGMADLLRPALYKAKHPIRILGKSAEQSKTACTFDVDGPLCENADRLGQNISLDDPQQGDLLLIKEAGAYGHTMACNYASSYRPAEVIVNRDKIDLVRKRETIEDVMRLEQ